MTSSCECPFFIFVIVLYTKNPKRSADNANCINHARSRGYVVFSPVVRRSTAWKWEWFVARQICFIRRQKNIKTQKEREEIRKKYVENTCVTGRYGDDEAICPDRTSSNLLLVRVESERVSLYNIIILLLSKRAAHAVPVNMSRCCRRLFEHDILHI